MTAEKQQYPDQIDADGRLWEYDTKDGVWFPPEYGDLEFDTLEELAAAYGPLTPVIGEN